MAAAMARELLRTKDAIVPGVRTRRTGSTPVYSRERALPRRACSLLTGSTGHPTAHHRDRPTNPGRPLRVTPDPGRVRLHRQPETARRGDPRPRRPTLARRRRVRHPARARRGRQDTHRPGPRARRDPRRRRSPLRQDQQGTGRLRRRTRRRHLGSPPARAHPPAVLVLDDFAMRELTPRQAADHRQPEDQNQSNLKSQNPPQDQEQNQDRRPITYASRSDGGHSARYLTDQAATGRENYYTGAVTAGEPPGRWSGKGAEMLGLTGLVDAVHDRPVRALRRPPRPGFRDPGAWAEADKLGHGGRRYASEEELYAKLLEGEPNAGAECRRDLQMEAGKQARKNVAFWDATFSGGSCPRTAQDRQGRWSEVHHGPARRVRGPGGPSRGGR